MKTRSFTSEQIGEWMATFYQFSTKEGYDHIFRAMRCVFDDKNDPDFWNEVCEAAKNRQA